MPRYGLISESVTGVYPSTDPDKAGVIKTEFVYPSGIDQSPYAFSEGLCKASWRYNATSNTIQKSINCSNFGDSGTGVFDVRWAAVFEQMPTVDGNFSWTGTIPAGQIWAGHWDGTWAKTGQFMRTTVKLSTNTATTANTNTIMAGRSYGILA